MIILRKHRSNMIIVRKRSKIPTVNPKFLQWLWHPVLTDQYSVTPHRTKHSKRLHVRNTLIERLTLTQPLSRRRNKFGVKSSCSTNTGAPHSWAPNSAVESSSSYLDLRNVHGRILRANPRSGYNWNRAEGKPMRELKKEKLAKVNFPK